MIYAAVLRARNAACQIIDEAQIGQPSTDRLAVERIVECGEGANNARRRMQHRYGLSTTITISMEMKICKP